MCSCKRQKRTSRMEKETGDKSKLMSHLDLTIYIYIKKLLH